MIPLEVSGNGGVVAHLLRYRHNFTVPPRGVFKSLLEEARWPFMRNLLEGRDRNMTSMLAVIDDLAQYSVNTFSTEDLYTRGLELIQTDVFDMIKDGTTYGLIESMWDMMVDEIEAEWKRHAHRVGGTG
jgi:hypothetical protein